MNPPDFQAVLAAAFTTALNEALAADAAADAAEIERIKAECAAKIAAALAADAEQDAAAFAAKDEEIKILNDGVDERDAEILRLKARIAELEAGQPAPNPVPEPEPEEPTEPGAFWRGLATVWPTAATTGPRIPVVAAPSGNVSGLVKGKRFTGTVKPANGTVFEDCEFVGNGGWGIDGDGRTFTVDHCKFLSTRGGPAAILGNATVISCDISGWEDAIKTQGSGWVIRGNYIHGPHITSTSHNDGIQVQWSNSNGLIEQNYISWRDTSEVFLQTLSGKIDSITIRHNWLGGSDLPLRIEGGCTNCTATENVIKQGNPTYPNHGYYDLNPQVRASGNIDAVTGKPI
ncbi:hypothetical protein MesoLjLc_50430 [Mesorhizobium sp. L-8-10]|uniref:right-handed parallel beta-helix repeat-containing protein n=1 Tax=Mesorhizobium sp. L-8-10 TaxID=2744523 RepID=UPI00192658BE|nr:right-handed parallel beta-helix repeat-containing protein [Mesorhizobium sp. L-8-10]BCH33113.1 hypothetical protein MesoLjLc_50430 [Mesorhizobium sp. L-8-10]